MQSADLAAAARDYNRPQHICSTNDARPVSADSAASL